MTKLRLDVVGDPIEHSKSPYIHKTVLAELNIPHEYRKVRVPKGQLEEYIKQLKRLEISGFNLTMPHKTDILPYLDYIDEEAKIFNSVNTVKVKDGKLLGYNTDSSGIMRAMTDKGFFATGKNIAILGAGGVASTAALKMAMENATDIRLFNRSLTSAKDIAQNVLGRTGKEISVHPFDYNALPASLKDCDILINCTPLGMTGTDCDFEDLSFLEFLKPGAIVYDLIYNPAETSLLKYAKGLGLETLNGLGMLIYQGLLADEIFLERKLDFDYLGEKIKDILKNSKIL